MKMLKITGILLITSIICSVVMVNAYDAPGTVFVNVKLDKNYGYETGTWTKTTYASQRYENQSSITVLTNPCRDCIIMAKPKQDNGDTFFGLSTRMGDTQTFPGASAQPGNFRLLLMREDWTLLETSHNAIWRIDR